MNKSYVFKLPISVVLKILNIKAIVNLFSCVLNHSHKKQKDSLDGSLDRVLFVAELEFPKILVPKLPQHTSDVNIECARKVKTTLLFTHDQLLRALIHFNFIILILIYFWLMMSGVKLCNIWLLLCENNSRSITIPELNTGEKYSCSYYSKRR